MQSVPLSGGPVRFAGAIGLRQGKDYVRPMRLPVEQLDLFHPDLISMAAVPAGVRLVFASDTRRVTLDVDQIVAEGMPLTPHYDLVIDDALAAQQSATRGGAQQIEFADLPAGPKRIELWLPQCAGVRVSALRVDEDARVEPVEERRRRWITYGSSITHCLEAASPTRTWPAVAARTADLDLLALGYAGQCHFDPLVARMIRDQPADCISLKLGINVQGAGTLTERSFASAVHGFLANVRDGHPNVPLTVVSPVHSPEREAEPGPGGLTLRQIREILADLVEVLRARIAELEAELETLREDRAAA